MRCRMNKVENEQKSIRLVEPLMGRQTFIGVLSYLIHKLESKRNGLNVRIDALNMRLRAEMAVYRESIDKRES